MEAAARLKAYVYSIEPTEAYDRRRIVDILAKMKVPEFVPRSGVKISVNDEEANASRNDMQSGQATFDLFSINHFLTHYNLCRRHDHTNSIADSDALSSIQASLPDPKALKLKLRPIEFEKDDDTNHHMDFIVAASNLRAENYDIAPADRHKVSS